MITLPYATNRLVLKCKSAVKSLLYRTLRSVGGAAKGNTYSY